MSQEENFKRQPQHFIVEHSNRVGIPNAYLFIFLGQTVNDLFKCKDLRYNFLNYSNTKKGVRPLTSDLNCKAEQVLNTDSTRGFHLQNDL